MHQVRPLSRDEVRSIDRRAIDEYGMAGLVLMENAGRGCAETLQRLGCRSKVTIVCGRGNNAGDGFVIARHLQLQGAEPHVVLLTDPSSLQGDAAANFNILTRCDIPIVNVASAADHGLLLRALAGAEWIIDAILGTGAVGAPRPPWDAVIETMNEHPARRLAVDLPSGLDCDTGLPNAPTVRADCTCTFVAPKRGFSHPAAQVYLGAVEVIDIGVPLRLLQSFSESPP